MYYEKLIKRSDKSQVKIRVKLVAESYKVGVAYRVEVEHKLPRKRTWIGFNTDDYTWRGLEFGSVVRDSYEHNWKLKYVSEQEILDAKLELWQSIKPE